MGRTGEAFKRSLDGGNLYPVNEVKDLICRA
nr:MAG TPA: hypothetical protein [Caudoviricetes sp.]